MVAALLALTAALAAPPPPPAPFQPAPEECPVADIQRDQALPPELAGDVATCDGVLLPRAYLLNYEQAAQDAELLRATWPPDPELPRWWDRPGWARVEGGAVVLVVVGMVAFALGG